MKFDGDKLRYDLIPPVVTRQLAMILTFGALKYDDNNWQNVDRAKQRYYAALMRHLEEWRAGDDSDDDSGCHHLAHALTNIAFLVWLENEDVTLPDITDEEVRRIFQETAEKYTAKRQEQIMRALSEQATRQADVLERKVGTFCKACGMNHAREDLGGYCSACARPQKKTGPLGPLEEHIKRGPGA